MYAYILALHIRWGAVVVGGAFITVVPKVAPSLLSSISIVDPSALSLVSFLPFHRFLPLSRSLSPVLPRSSHYLPPHSPPRHLPLLPYRLLSLLPPFLPPRSHIPLPLLSSIPFALSLAAPTSNYLLPPSSVSPLPVSPFAFRFGCVRSLPPPLFVSPRLADSLPSSFSVYMSIPLAPRHTGAGVLRCDLATGCLGCT